MRDDQQQKKTGLKDKIVLEMIAYWINVLYLTLIFAVFFSYKRLILANYYISYTNWGIGLIKALVLAKVIMIGGLFRFTRSLDNKPLILPTLFKTFIFTLWVAVFAAVESAIRGFLHGKGLNGALDHLLSEGTHEFYAKCLAVFVAFIPFFAFKELGRLLGKGKIWQLFFREGPLTEADLVEVRMMRQAEQQKSGDSLSIAQGQDDSASSCSGCLPYFSPSVFSEVFYSGSTIDGVSVS